MLDKQINLYSVDTNAFLSYKEKAIKSVRSNLIKYKYNLEQRIKNEKDKDKKEKLSYMLDLLKKRIKNTKKDEKEKLLKEFKKVLKEKEEGINKELRILDKNYIRYFKTESDGRRKEYINQNKVVSMFESSLSRSFGIKTNELTTEIIIVESYFFDILEDLIVNGFIFDGNKYIYFSSSAGQIRTKKAVFVREKKYEECKNKLMCGLSIESINKMGGMNINKFLAYLALSNSATEIWKNIFDKEFDIDRCIVVDDFETLVKCKVDHINYENYEITKDVIEELPIPHTDGCGMISKDYCETNFMVRLPWIKGLLGSFDFKKFINENKCSSKVEDIWGKEWDIFEDDIQIIFTKSQLKMWKYYKDWEQYKDYFKKYNCDACICNIEEEKISNAKINYQMLQTLYKMTDEEIKDICRYSNKKIKNLSNSLENILKIFGIVQEDVNDRNGEDVCIKTKSNFQKALELYPELIKDKATKEDIKAIKDSLVKKYKGGKLEVLGKFTFVLPDLYAFCEWLFMGKEKPKGLLSEGEVYCSLYKNANTLDCLRSPSLYIEHAIRKNIASTSKSKIKEYFTTNAIYTSTHDLISRILQFDVDGDKLLVLSQKKIIEVAKRCMDKVNPLYYEMKKANAEELNNKNICKGLNLAFTGGNIGAISNDITKIWNSPNGIGDNEINSVKWLCMENNFVIDYAKTLFKPIRPEENNEIIKSFHSMKVPYFFQFAKNKKPEDCEPINDSVMNKICANIEDSRLSFNSVRNLNQIDYNILCRKNRNEEFLTKEKIEKVINMYNYFNIICRSDMNIEKYDNTHKNGIAYELKQKINEILFCEDSDILATNVLAKYLYETSNIRKKNLFWHTYGDIALENIKNNLGDDTEYCLQCGRRVNKGKLVNNKCDKCRKEEIKKLGGKKKVKCIDCGKEFEVDTKSNKEFRCKDCYKIYRKEYLKNKKREERKNVNSTN